MFDRIRKKRLLAESTVVLLALTAMLCLTFWRFLLPSEDENSLFFGCDYWVQQYPNIVLGREMIRDRALPFWEPYSSLGGRPAMAEPVRGYLYPPNFLLFVAGTQLSDETYQSVWVFRVLLHIAFGGVGVFLIARAWNIHFYGAFLAAILFSMSAFQQATLHLANFTDGFSLPEHRFGKRNDP